MNPEPTGRLGNVVTAVGENSMNVFPLGLSKRGHRDLVVALRHFNVGPSPLESSQDIVDISRLGKKVNST